MKKTLLLVFASCFILSCNPNRKVSPPSENIFRYALSAKITSIDPHATSDVYSTIAESLVYESLYEWHYLKKPAQIRPLLAKELPEISKDKKTFTFKLKKGIHFQDDPCFKNGKGRELVAQDLVYTLHRIADPKLGLRAYSNYEGFVVGINAYHSGKAKKISGVKALDKYTVQIKLTKPMPRFYYNFADIHSAVMAKECVQKYGDEISTHPVGTGAFKIVEFNPSHKVVAVRNPNYKTTTHPSNPEAQLPFLEKVVLEVITQDQPTWLKFRAGETEISRIPKDNFASIFPQGSLSKDLLKRGVKHFKKVQSDVTTFIFNMESPIWGKKKELRQAFALALDVPELIELQYSGQAVRAHSIISPGEWGYNPDFKSRWAVRDIQKAKQLLKKAGFPDGIGLPPLEMMTGGETSSRQLFEMIKKQVAEIGIKLVADVVTFPEMLRKMNEKTYTITGIGYAANVPDADTSIGIYHSRYVAPGPNAANYRNSKVDKLIDEIESLENGPIRKKKINEFQRIVDEDLPYVVVVHRLGNRLVQPWVKDYVYWDEVHLGTFMKYQRVEPDEAKKQN